MKRHLIFLSGWESQSTEHFYLNCFLLLGGGETIYR